MKRSRPSLLFVNQHYWPDLASTAQHLTDLAEYLVADGFDVTVWCSRGRYQGGESDLPTAEERNGVHVRRLRSTAFGRGRLLGRAADYLSFYACTSLRLAAGRRYDLVVFLTTPSILSFVGRVARELRGQRYGVWSMDLHPEIEEALGIFSPGRPFTRLLHAMSRAGHGGADFVVALGPWMKRRLLDGGAPEERLFTIPVWSHGEEVYPVPPERNPLRRKLGLENRFVLMYSGNAGLAHRFDEVLEAMARLRAEPGVFFLFVGDGPRKREILRYVRQHRIENFRYLDYFPRERLHESLSLGDVHLLTLRPDMSGLVAPGKLAGIMAAGRPVVMVGPRGSDPGKTILDEEVGVVIDPEAAGADATDQLVLAIREFESSPERCRRLGEAARGAFLERYDRPLACQEWARLLRSHVTGVVAVRGEADGRPALKPEGAPAGAGRREGTKRLLDAALAAAGLTLSAPAWALVSLAIKLDDGGPVLVSQERVGKHGHHFRSWKFRSMTPRGSAEGPLLRAELEADRVTRVGRLLRATALDELPQLWNILKGEMSFVGPRALLPEEVTAVGEGPPVRLVDLPGHVERCSVRPGLTGLAQVRLRRDATHRQKFRYDLLYVRRRTLWLDVRLILQSVWISLRAAWPRVGRQEGRRRPAGGPGQGGERRASGF